MTDLMRLPWAQAQPTASDPVSHFGYGISPDDFDAVPSQPLDKVKIPTTLALIEVLQFLRHLRGLDPGERPAPGSFRVAILLSAWDAMENTLQNVGPSRYLTTELPLLFDFLWSNFGIGDFHCFGVSSTGGDLLNETYRKQYLDDPRGFVTWSDVSHRVHRTDDLTLPVRWALFGSAALPLEP